MGPCPPDSPCARLKILIRVEGHQETSRQANPAHVSRTNTFVFTGQSAELGTKEQKRARDLNKASPQPQRRHPPYQARRLTPEALQERSWPAHSPRCRAQQASFVHTANDKRSRERQQQLLTSSLRLRWPEGRQRRRRRAPWDVSRGQRRWLHAAEASP